jgi:hypothetical protein
VTYVEKQPSLEDVFFAVVHERGWAGWTRLERLPEPPA